MEPKKIIIPAAKPGLRFSHSLENEPVFIGGSSSENLAVYQPKDMDEWIHGYKVAWDDTKDLDGSYIRIIEFFSWMMFSCGKNNTRIFGKKITVYHSSEKREYRIVADDQR